MNTEIRVMLCDDSAIMRRLIKSSLQIEPRLKVVCEAKHGGDAVEKFPQAKPDVIIMDVEMPVLDGVEAVRELRRRGCKTPIIMFSSLTSRGAEASLDAIAAGATDFATKPVGSGHIAIAMKSLQRDLIPKLVLWADKKQNSSFRQPQLLAKRPPTSASSTTPPRSATLPKNAAQSSSRPCDDSPTSPSNSLLDSRRVSMIAVGVSTGGPQALATMIGALPKPLPVPMVITQHMPPVFTGLLAQRLSAQCKCDVREAKDGEELVAGSILIAPGDFHLSVLRHRAQVQAKLDQEAAVNSCRPSVDPLFFSVAKFFGKQALGIVLTGMGQDGADGAKRLRDAGGAVIVQDQESSVVWGMPGEVAKRGLADCVLPIDQIGIEVSRMICGAKSPRRPVLSQ